MEPVAAEPENPKEAAAIGAVQDAQSEAASPHVPEGQGASQEEVTSLKAGGADEPSSKAGGAEEPSIIREPEHVAEEVSSSSVGALFQGPLDGVVGLGFQALGVSPA